MTSVIFTVPAQTAIAADLADGQQLRTLLSSNTLQGSSPKAAFSEYYDPNGTLRGKSHSGKCKIDGNKGCMDYGNGYQCWTIVIDGNANIWYKDGKVGAAAMMLPGNPHIFNRQIDR